MYIEQWLAICNITDSIAGEICNDDKGVKNSLQATYSDLHRRRQLCVIGAATNELSLLLSSFPVPPSPFSPTLPLPTSPPYFPFPSLSYLRRSGGRAPSVLRSCGVTPGNFFKFNTRFGAVWWQMHKSAVFTFMITIMNIVGVGAAFCMGCCPNIRNGAAIAAPAVWVSPPMVTCMLHNVVSVCTVVFYRISCIFVCFLLHDYSFGTQFARDTARWLLSA